MAFEKDLTIYDAAYVALAEVEDAELITYDEFIFRKVRRSTKAADFLRRVALGVS